jgi:hypothetical protein
MAPFAWRQILIAHIASAVPLGLVIAGSSRLRRPSAWQWGFIGLAVLAIAMAAFPAISSVTVDAAFGQEPQLLLRSLLATVLVLPWCFAAINLSPTPTSERSATALVAGIGLAVVPCGLYAESVMAGRSKEADDLLAQRRLVRADRVLVGLSELGSDRPVRNTAPADLRKRLASRVSALRQQADAPLPESIAAEPRIDRAIMLVELERLDDAAAVLSPLVPGDDTASEMLAAIYRDQKRWRQSDAVYAHILANSLPHAEMDPSARTRCRTAVEALVNNAEADGRSSDAEAVLQLALENAPSDGAHYHFLFGRHHQAAGRFALAQQHLREAVRLDSANYGKPADELFGHLRTSTPGCFAGSPWSERDR